MGYDLEDPKSQIEDDCKDPENYVKEFNYKENAEDSNEDTKSVTGSHLRLHALARQHGGRV